MDKKIRTFWILAAVGIIAALFVAESVGIGLAQEGSDVVSASIVSTEMNYQGMLTASAGGLLNGTYTMTFNLYDILSGGTALDTDTHSVEVENGLFNTEIDFDQSFFDGRALWLGITVGTDSEMTPRQELRPVPYALSLRPGAVITGSLSGPVLKVNSNGNHGQGVYAYTTGNYSEGVYAGTDGDNSEGVYAVTTGDNSNGVYAGAAGDNSKGVYARTTGKDSPAVYGWSEQDVGVYGKGKEGGYFEASDSSGKGVYGKATNSGDVRNYGGYFVADGIRGRGIYGKASNTRDAINYGGFFYASGVQGRGVFGQAAGSSGYGVKGWASNEGDVVNYGGHFCAAGSKGIGVYGWAEYEGDGANYGGYFLANGSGGTGVYAHTTGDHSTGVIVSTNGDDSTGVFAHTEGDYSDGVSVRTVGYSSDGVSVCTFSDWSMGAHVSTGGDHSTGVIVSTNGDDSTGVFAHTEGDYSDGVVASTHGDGSKGVNAYSAKGYGVYAEGKKAGIYAEGIDGGYAAEFDGNVKINTGRVITPVLEITGGSDLSEQFEIRGIEAEISPSPGMVVSIDPERPGELVVSNEAYDRRVAGIISGAGGLNPGMLMGQNGSEADGGYPVALSGRVYCWADASNGPIEPGDLLTASETPGHAMKVTDRDRAHGAIIGKAMTGLEEGKGLVLVLVALQ